MKHLNDQEAVDRVVIAVQNFYKKHQREPTQIKLSWRMALYMLKAGVNFYGSEVYIRLWFKGPKALEEITLLGCKVIVEQSSSLNIKCS
jgi:hypothetical protein